MAIKIGSNIASIQAQRRLGEATSSLSQIYERLSSGQRINHASDDPAGLAISQDLNVKSRIFGQAIRNINDGISVHSIADATVEALSDINIRLKELAEQSANGTYSKKQREALDSEAQALSKEYFRVSRSAQFNGQRLFDGSMSEGLRLQIGIGEEGSILTHVGGKLGNGTVTATSQFTTETGISFASQLGDLNGDGILDLVTAGYGDDDSGGGYATVRLGNGNGNFGTATSFTTESVASAALALGDLNGDGILDLVTTGQSASTGVSTVRLGMGNGNFGTATSFTTEGTISCSLALGDLNGDGILDMVSAGSAVGGGHATIRLGSGNGSFGAATSYTTESTLSYAISLGDLNNDGILDLITAGQNASGGGSTVRLGNGNGNFGAATSFTMEGLTSRAISLGDLNGDGILDMVTAGYHGSPYDGSASIRLGNGNGNFGAVTSIATEAGASLAVSLGDVNGDEVTDIVTAGASNAPYNGYATVSIGNTRDGISALQPFSIKTKADALQAMGLFSRNQDNLLSLRGTIGATLSRLDTASANLTATREDYIAASSRITDADIAQEAANLIRTQILQQTAASILAQANQQPRLVLKLLQQK